MTPYAYKASPERRMQLEQKAHLQVTASFQIYLFKALKSHLTMAFYFYSI